MAITPEVQGDRLTGQARRGRVRTAIFVVAVLAIQLGFILSYVGAFHAPKADAITVQVGAPASVSAELVGELNGITGTPVEAVAASSAASALDALKRDEISGIFTVDPAGTTDTLTVAGAGGASIVTALQTVFTEADATQHRTVTVTDALPVQSGDGRGLTAFYLVTGWIIGGYLLAAVLGILLGTTLSGVRAALGRIAIFVPYAVPSGIGGGLVVDQALGAVTGHFWPIAAVGALVVMASSMVTVALQSFLGIIGIGITIVIFVVLGNPSAGGAYQAQVLPPFWRAISGVLPNGAATSAVRHIVYFAGVDVPGELLVVAIWAVAGLALTFVAAGVRGRRSPSTVAA